MAKYCRSRVLLPHPRPYVDLPKRLAPLLQRIIEAGSNGINSFELQETGILRAPNEINALRKLGAQIQTRMDIAYDPQGNPRRRVAYYVYQGWDADLSMHSPQQGAIA